jgi:hypothetical protein
VSASQNNLSLVINQQDSTGVNILNRSIGAISYAGLAGQFVDGILTGTGLVAQTLPTANILQFYFKNTHATAVITITATPQGGSSAVVVKVQPGAVFVNWCASTSGTAGYTAISLTSDTANATYEMYLGG